MITKRTTRITLEAIAALEGRVPGISLEAIEGSPVDLLADYTRAPVSNTGDFSLEEIGDAVQARSVLPIAEGTVMHDIVMSETAPLTAEKIMDKTRFTREVFLPAVATVDEKVKAAVDHFKPIRLFPQQYVVNKIFSSTMLMDSISRFENTPLEKDLTRLGLSNIDDATAVELLRTGLGDWDSAIVDFIASKPEGYVAAVYNSVFGQGDDSGMVGTGPLRIEPVSSDTVIDISIGDEDFILTAYLLSSVLYASPSKEAVMTLTQWQDILSRWISQCGKALLSFIQFLGARIRQGHMVLEYPSVETVWKETTESAAIVVLSNIYQKWIADGGTPEKLIGVLFVANGRPPYTVHEIDALGDSAMSGYDQYENRLDSEVRRRASAIIGSSFAIAVSDIVHGTDPSLLKGSPQHIQDTLSEIARSSSIDWSDTNIYLYARDFLAKEVFNCDFSMSLIKRIDEITAVDNTRTPQEAAYLAIRDKVADYIASQIEVK